MRRKWNNDKCQHECKKPIKHLTCEENYTCNSSTYPCKCDKHCDIVKYLKAFTCMKSLVDDVVVTYDEIVDTPETTLINPKKTKLLAYCFCPFNCLFLQISQILEENSCVGVSF